MKREYRPPRVAKLSSGSSRKAHFDGKRSLLRHVFDKCTFVIVMGRSDLRINRNG